MGRSSEGSELESSFNNEKLDLIYIKCKHIINHVDHYQVSSFSGPTPTEVRRYKTGLIRKGSTLYIRNAKL